MYAKERFDKRLFEGLAIDLSISDFVEHSEDEHLSRLSTIDRAHCIYVFAVTSNTHT